MFNFTRKQYGSARPRLNTLKKTTPSGKEREVRSFSVYSVNEKEVAKEDKGRYLASTPKAAASKAFSRWCKENRKRRCAATITMVETTRGNPHKEYSYSAVRKNNKAKTMKEGQKINYKYTNELMKA